MERSEPVNVIAQSTPIETPPAPESPRVPVDWVRRAGAGDAAAFGQLYEATVDRIHRYVWLRVRDADVAADLTQDIYVNALRGLPRLDAPERFEAWLLRIAHNRVVNHWVGAGRRAGEASIDADEDDEGGGPSVRNLADPNAEALDDIALTQVRLEDLSHHLGVLSEAQQEVLALRFGTGLSLAETAAQLGRTEMAIKQLQRRALVTLRERLRAAEVSR